MVNAGWYCENPYELHDTDWGKRFEHEFNQITFAHGVNHDLGHITNGCVDGRWRTKEKIMEELRGRTMRETLAAALNLVDMQNCRIMSMLHQISKSKED